VAEDAPAKPASVPASLAQASASDRPSPAPGGETDGKFNVRSRLLDAPVHTVRPPRQASPAEPPAKLGAGAFVGTFLIMASLGYVGWSHLRPVLRANTPAPPVASAADPGGLGEGDLLDQSAASSERAPAPAPSVVAGRSLPFVDRSRGIEVGEQQGLLVLEHESAAPPPRLSLSGRDLPPPPTALAVDAGRHELVLANGDMTRFHYLVIRAGETRIVQVDALYAPEPSQPREVAEPMEPAP
jgi:hypothetical protein